MKNRDQIEFFSEIYVEELPARLVNDLGLQLKNNFVKGLAEYNIEYLDIISKNTPRRLTIYINGLDKKTKDKKVEIGIFKPDGRKSRKRKHKKRRKSRKSTKL